MTTNERIKGRATLGETKKLSLTLEPKEWVLLDKYAEGNRSNFLRTLFMEFLRQEQSNEPVLHFEEFAGLLRKALSQQGYDQEKIDTLIKSVLEISKQEHEKQLIKLFENI